MKRLFIIPFIIFLLGSYTIRGQNTAGTDFWVTFGKNRTYNYSSICLQISIISGDYPCSGTLYFTDIGKRVNFNIAARQKYNYTLKNDEKQAVLNTIAGVSNKSVHITSDYPITVYAMNQALTSTDATNVLPVTILDNTYYHISYTSNRTYSDAYAVIGAQNNTTLYHNGIKAAMLDSGQVYYRTSVSDMTGALITADHPVAFFALSQGAEIPAGFEATDHLMQQLPPINTWGTTFFVPVSHLTRDIVRIVASENNTNIKQTGGKLLFPDGGQTSLTNLKAGQFVELELDINNHGGYIEANKPVGVCAYLTGSKYNNSSSSRVSDPAQCWISSINQNVTEVLTTPFVPADLSRIKYHYALIITSTATKDNTRVSIGRGAVSELFGGSWIDHVDAKMSFYNMPMLKLDSLYSFTNQKGLFVISYGVGMDESYSFNNYFALSKNPFAAFYVNDIFYQDLKNQISCTSEIVFRAELSESNIIPGSLKWYIDGNEEFIARDKLLWDKFFPAGNYEIRMDFTYANGNEISLETNLIIGVPIHTLVFPAEGGYIIGDTCYEIGKQAHLTALPNTGFEFIDWTEESHLVSTDSILKFMVTDSRSLVANFSLKYYDITVSANPTFGGTVSENYYHIPHGASVTVSAIPNPTYNFINWTHNGIPVSTDETYIFSAVESCNLVANFELKRYHITTLANPTTGGNTTGDGFYSIGDTVTVSAIANEYFNFVNWTENDTIISTDISYKFKITQSHILVANFNKRTYNVKVSTNENDYGYITGMGLYESLDTVRLEAIAYDCYRFSNWTIDDVVVSNDKTYQFIITENINLEAHFYALDFDTYSPILWDNTFMLNLRKLREEGYEFTGCLWYKNGIEEKDTRTINVFSYSAGPYEIDLLELSPTYYKFELITNNFGNLCSTNKIIDGYTFRSGLLAYPNPVLSGSQLVIEGFVPNHPIYLYNQYGACVGSSISNENTVTLILNYPPGIYLIRSDNKTTKILILK